MKVWVLIGVVEYERDTIVGVYSTQEKAQEAEKAERAKKDRCWVDRWEIEELTVQ